MGGGQSGGVGVLWQEWFLHLMNALSGLGAVRLKLARIDNCYFSI